jgi:hypothetical protein
LRTLILQPWISPSSANSTQGAEGWLDVSGYADLGFWVDSVGSGTLLLESSPSWDANCFQSIGPTVALAGGLQTVFSVRAASTVPVSRWLRWRLSGFSNPQGLRIRVAPSRQPFFFPAQLGGLAFWLRADLGVTSSGGNVSALNDQSDVGDSNENLTAFNNPTLNSNDSNFNKRASIGFAGISSQYLTSGAWATPLQQPCTWVAVALNNGTNQNGEYVIDSNDSTTGQKIQYTATPTTSITVTANGASFSGAANWAAAAAVLVEFNGASSKLFFNNFTTPLATGTVGGGSAGSQGSLSVGTFNAHKGGGNYWDGSMSEILAFSGILSSASKARLRRYLNSRYKLSIT